MANLGIEGFCKPVYVALACAFAVFAINTGSINAQSADEAQVVTNQRPATPKQVVKVLLDPSTNRLTLVGSPEDILIVKRAILDLQSKLRAKPEFRIERITLTFQLADTVSKILGNALKQEANVSANLKISPLHFPESILLIGPPRSVKRAKEIIKTIDSHDYFSSDPIESKATNLPD